MAEEFPKSFVCAYCAQKFECWSKHDIEVALNHVIGHPVIPDDMMPDVVPGRC